MMTRKAARTLWVILLFIITALTACKSIEHTPEFPPPRTETTKEGVRLTLSLDKSEYQPGETVHITVTVENQNQNPLDYTLWNIGDPAIYVTLADHVFASGYYLHEDGYIAQAVHATVTGGVLPPKETITRLVVWDQQILTSPDPIQAPIGSYSVKAKFYIGKYESNTEPTELSASIDVKIVDSWQIIPPQEAYEIARNTPEVVDWIAAHSGDNLVKLENGQYYINWGSSWDKVTANFEVYGFSLDELKNSYEPDHHLSLVKNGYAVRFISKLGPLPNEITVQIEPVSGKVLSVQIGQKNQPDVR